MISSVKNYGLILDPIVAQKDYIFGGYGSIGGEILQPDANWKPFLPDGEQQYEFGFEPSACASFGTLNALEILLRHIYGEVDNFSDRFLAKMSNTTPDGNSPQTVAETLRKKGCVKEYEWPYLQIDDTWDTYYEAIPLQTQILGLGEFAEFDFKHEYVPTTATSLKSALKYSPLGISVSAWQQDQNGLYISTFPNNHWCVLVGYKDGEYWEVYDSYIGDDGSYIKKLAWNHNFGIAKRYSVKIQVVNMTAFQQFITWLKHLWLF